MKKELAIQTINQLLNEDVSINDIIEALYIGIKIENENMKAFFMKNLLHWQWKFCIIIYMIHFKI